MPFQYNSKSILFESESTSIAILTLFLCCAILFLLSMSYLSLYCFTFSNISLFTILNYLLPKVDRARAHIRKHLRGEMGPQPLLILFSIVCYRLLLFAIVCYRLLSFWLGYSPPTLFPPSSHPLPTPLSDQGPVSFSNSPRIWLLSTVCALVPTILPNPKQYG